MAPQALALLLALCWAAAAAAPLQDACEQELNKIKDQLQVSCVGRGLTSPPAGLPLDTGILLLSANRLARLSLAAFGHLRNLTELDLANNGLAALQPDDASLPALQQLSLAHNALQSLPVLRGMPGLQRLVLGHNALAQLPEGGFRALPDLLDLDLQSNRLRLLAPGAFAGLVELRDLDLSDNALEALPPALLADLQALQILGLERNRLRALPDGFFRRNLFAYIYLHGNPWRCDCRLRYLRDWIVDNEISVYTRLRGPKKDTTELDSEGVVCSAPPELQGSPVMDFQASCRDPGDGEGGAQEEEEAPGSPSTAAPPPPSTPGPPYDLPTAVPTSAAGLPAHTTATPTVQGTASPPGTLRTSEPPSLGGARLLRTAPSLRARPGPTALPSRCLCPAVQVRALQAPIRHRSPAPRASRLALLCCLLRLALYAACLALGSLPLLLGGCYWAWEGLSGRLRALPEPPPAGRRPLQQQSGVTSRAGCRLYYVCKEFQLAPSSHVAWLLISLPGPAGRRRCGRGPSSGGRRDSAGAASAL